ERPDGRRTLETRECRTQAEVVASAERDVAVGVLAAKIEPVGVVELGRVAVCRAAQGNEVLTLRDRDVAQLVLAARDALRELHRAVEAQQLLDGVPVQGRVVAQALELVALLQQGK